MQIFSRNPRGAGLVNPLDAKDNPPSSSGFANNGTSALFSVHTNYLINLASSKPELYEKSIEQFVIDLERTEALGAEYLVTHLGSASGQEPGWMIGAYQLH